MKIHNLYTIIPYKDHLLKFSEAESGRAYFKDHYVDLLTGITHPFNIEDWRTDLDYPIVSASKDNKRIIHLFYELGFLFEDLSDVISSSELLAIDIRYQAVKSFKPIKDFKKIRLKIEQEPLFGDYQKKFREGYEELEKGNCYQFNLTEKFVYSFADDYSPDDFIWALWRKASSRGGYGSATYIYFWDKLFLSNSPECLFQYEDKNKELVTRPIKGTLKIKADKSLQSQWKKLETDQKSQAELYMITDLLRNDLCRIDLPNAVVIKKKARLLVPGLVHQYSEIKIKLRDLVTIKKILDKVFPGGSITGAPKKRVMQILKRLEQRPRGFYCGSTLLFSAKGIMASINIRSCEIDFNRRELNYQAGGGVTLLSTAQGEYAEVLDKRDSIIDLLTL